MNRYVFFSFRTTKQKYRYRVLLENFFFKEYVLSEFRNVLWKKFAIYLDFFSSTNLTNLFCFQKNHTELENNSRYDPHYFLIYYVTRCTITHNFKSQKKFYPLREIEIFGQILFFVDCKDLFNEI